MIGPYSYACVGIRNGLYFNKKKILAAGIFPDKIMDTTFIFSPR